MDHRYMETLMFLGEEKIIHTCGTTYFRHLLSENHFKSSRHLLSENLGLQVLSFTAYLCSTLTKIFQNFFIIQVYSTNISLFLPQ